MLTRQRGRIGRLRPHAKSVQRNLLAREERLQLALRAVQMGIWERDLATGQVIWSSEVEAIYGLAPGTFAGTYDAVLSFVHPDDRERVICMAQQIIGSGADYDVEYRIYRPDGGLRWVWARGNVIRDATGQAVRLIGVAQDITARKCTEEEIERARESERTLLARRIVESVAELRVANTQLRESHLFIEQITKLAPAIVYVFDLIEQRNIFANREITTILGYTPEEVQAMGSTFPARLMHPDDFARYPAMHERLRALEDGEIATCEFRMAHANGAWRWLATYDAAFTRDRAGFVTQVLGIALDITQRKEAETALNAAYARLELLNQDLQHSRDLLRTIFNGLSEGLLLLDQDGTVLALNESLATMLHERIDRCIGQPWAALCRRRTPAFPGAWIVNILEDALTHYRRERTLNREGKPCILDIRTLPLKRPDHTVEQVLIHITDVTERVQIEAQLIEKERFAASGRLAATVAHEINTPLQAVESCLHLAEQAPTEQRQSYLTLAREEILRVGRILRQLLDLCHSGNGVPTALDLNALIERVALLTSSTLARQNIALQLDLAHGLPPVQGRADEITQVLLNLIFNAVEAMPDGGALRLHTALRDLPIFSTISTTPTDAETTTAPCIAAPCVILDVADTGVGIQPEMLEHIFEPFFTTKHGGSGIGLAICRQIISRHGGQIKVRSTDGGGSTFTIAFPLQRLSGEEERRAP